MMVEDERAPIAARLKKSPPTNDPAGICKNESGIAEKMSPMPIAGSKLNWNTIGKIIKPATIATMVADVAIGIPSLVI